MSAQISIIAAFMNGLSVLELALQNNMSENAIEQVIRDYMNTPQRERRRKYGTKAI